MDSTAAVRTVRLHRALGLGLFGAGVVTVLSLFGGASDAHADGLIPVVDELLGTVGAVVDTVQAPVTTVVDTVIAEVVTPVAVVADTVVSEVPIVNTVVASTVGASPVTDIIAAVGTTLTTTVGGVNTAVDAVTGAVLPAVPNLPETPDILLPGILDGLAGPVIPSLTVTSETISGADNSAARTTVSSPTFDAAAELISASGTPAPRPAGESGSSLPIALAPSGSAASNGGSAGGSASADSAAPHLTFALPVTGRESARDDDLPPSPSSEFDTSPD